MLDGKELEYKMGEYGSASVDVTPELMLEVQVGVKVDLIAEIKKLAPKTATPLDDNAIAFVEGLVRKAKEAKA